VKTLENIVNNVNIRYTREKQWCHFNDRKKYNHFTQSSCKITDHATPCRLSGRTFCDGCFRNLCINSPHYWRLLRPPWW